MSDQPNNSLPIPPPNRRRGSLVELFGSRSSASTSVSSSPPSAAVPTTPNAGQHRRGISITSLGLTANGQTSNSLYNAFAKQRRASIATSSASGSPEFRNSFGDDSALIEDDEQLRSSNNAPPSPSFARRVSFGAQALRDVRQGSNFGTSGGGRRPSSSLFTLDENNENNPAKTRPSPRTAKTTGEGFNWSESLRDRTKRSPSFSSGNPFASNTNRPRAPSSSAPEPPKEIPKPVEQPAIRRKKPDHLGERMLRGDFMMD